MANWYGAARSNYVRVVDEDMFRAQMKRLGLHVFEACGGNKMKKFGVSPSPYSEDGSWPSFIFNFEVPGLADDEGDDVVEEEHTFEFETDVMPYVEVGQVLVVMQAGAEKLRYITGSASAFVRRASGEVEVTYLGIDEIYSRAADQFEIPESEITPAEY